MAPPPAWAISMAIILGSMTTSIMGGTINVALPTMMTIQSMVAFRIIQAMGAGYLFPLAMTIMHETFPPQERGFAMGIFTAGISIGPAIGPWLGGYLIEHLSWRAIFYMNLPIGLAALLVATATLPAGGRRQPGTIDLLGLVTLAAFIVSFLLAVSQARDYGWSDA
ncbi:MAG: hypothetical protein ETSY1_16470 [Candidatus Entotheonella factor]|uniref:Major facilitator superfamily (MFS) profile domain-containing protein n=1 Tax=Entotheonella factor TaxID=1429438 RepID=W4LM21_ENTF1|nr:MAG: hypothetical protein ETSY1_16470 [Candidatus Entotheonella factor]